MKKNVFFIFASAALLFTGCYDAVYQSIRNEVALEDASISGYINSIVRFTKNDGEYLYLQNGRVYYKQADNHEHGAWKRDATAPASISYDYYENEFDGNNFYRLAADDTYLYALSYTPRFDDEYSRNVPTEIHLWCTDGNGSWEKVAAIDEAIEAYRSALRKKNFMMDANIALFCTNTPQKEHRRAYIRIGGGSTTADSDINKKYGEGVNKGVIELNGPKTAAATIPAGTQGAGLNTVSAVYFGGDYILLDHLASTTNETAESDATFLYFADDETLCCIDIDSYANGIDFSNYKDNASFKYGKIFTGTVLSMTTTADSLLFGTHRSGVYNIALKDGKPAEDDNGNIKKAQHLEVSGSSILESPYIIRTILCTDPAVGETAEGSAIYCSLQFQYTAAYSSTSYDNVGLWSYYESRGNWNRE